MATSLTTHLHLLVKAVETDAVDLSIPIDDLAVTLLDILANGTGSDQADKMYHDRFSLNNAATTLDLHGGLSDQLGNAFSFKRVKLLLVINHNTVDGEFIEVGGDGNAFLFAKDKTDIVPVKAGGCLLVFAPKATGLPVTNNTGDILKFSTTVSTANVTADVIIVGATA